MATNLNKDAVYRAAKPKDKDYSVSDGGGLALKIKADGTKRWTFFYRLRDGTKNYLGFGEYPATTLENARRQAEQCRQQIAEGIDPGETRRKEKAAKQLARQNQSRQKEGLPIIDSFADVTCQWLASIAHITSNTTHTKKTSRIERLAFPSLGDKPIKEIKAADVLAVLKPLIDKQQLETAHRLHAEISSIFDYGITHGFVEFNQAQPVAKQIPAQKVKHRAAIIEPKQVGQLLRDIYAYQGTYVVQMALRLSPLLFQNSANALG